MTTKLESDRFMYLYKTDTKGLHRPILYDRLRKREHSPPWVTRCTEKAGIWLVQKQDDIETDEFLKRCNA